MPKLKQLVLQGFKSFGDTTTIVFPTGTTAIIGPNGSGKSNVADAIRWVLGEQRTRMLRGRTGEDMIFAGSQRRPRASMARVVLTFDNSEAWLPLDFAEVTIERRAYRSGESEYLLNGSRVRLMDLNELLNKAGLGREAYLFIGQGLVDRVLSLTPQERTQLFEQAAGIALYRQRREEALKKLEETRHNLERVQDILSEIEPRLRRLERQAQRVAQHTKLTGELKELLRTWYGYRWGQAVAALELAHQRSRVHETEVGRRQEAAAGLTTRIGALRQQLSQLRSRLAELHRVAGARHAEAEALQRDLAVGQERARLLTEQQEEGRANVVPLRAAWEAGATEIAALRAELATGAARLAEERDRLTQAEVAYQALEARRGELIRRQGETQSHALEARHRLADRQSRLEQMAERTGQLAQRITELEAALASAAGRRRAQQTAVEETRRALVEAEAALQDLEAEQERLRAAQEAARAEGDRLRRELAQQEAQRQQLSARLAALERLHAEGAGLYAGVRAVLGTAAREELPGLLGTIATLVQVPPRLDHAVEVALGGQLQDVVARRWQDAEAAIAWLKRNRAGRVTFLPLDTLRPPPPLRLPTLPGVIGVAADLVTYEAELRPALLLLLGRVAVAESLEAARALFKELTGGFQIVTLEGELLRSGGALTGGHERKEQQDGGLLARERERRELPTQLAAVEEAARTLRDAARRAEEQVRILVEEGRALQERRRVAERQHQEANRRVEQAVRALEQAAQEAGWQRKLLEEARTERERLEGSRQRLERERDEATAALAAAGATLEQLAADLAALADDESARLAAEQRTRVALLEQEHENRRRLLAAREKEQERLADQIAAQERRVAAIGDELTALAAHLEELQARYAAGQAAAEALSAQVPPLETQVETAERDQVRWEQAEAEARRLLREAEQRLAQAQVEVRRREDETLNLRREIQETLGIVDLPLPSSLTTQQPLPLESVAPFPAVAELPEGLEEQIADLRAQIHRLEPINLAAQEEYNEVAERHTFLQTQINDLEAASTHLRKIVTELDSMIETAFQTTFKAIAAEFGRIFALLFNGGTASLTLISNGEQTGVEITARPPGKRTAGLGMLSGGERTLTAVALLFAVLRVSPVPFCVLDEVDAALDEANVGRFRAMLRELARQTQFIVITHNQGTVEAADTIYGVSMGEESVSQVLSLSLADLPAE